MKRDMDLVRDILLAIEAKPSPKPINMTELEVPDHPDSSSRRKHIVMLAGAGFLDCEPTRSKTNPDRIHHVLVFDLSWKGHDYLDSIRDPKVWKKIKEKSAQIGNTSFEFTLEIAKALAKQQLKSVGLDV
ncbi:DUF2513 domain-containing protein [Sphingopyxis sp. KK2]|uniref:DUF2513 domain-containing protein n=1 Tax=Sphingopyxis sp. KK2 TaxID=1855727 RepID=UPI00097E729D|nr:DUF2513 domain-containing protein [Sphingopyxis sp. KK2]